MHVDGVELAVRPTHSVRYLDGIIFKKAFHSTSESAFVAAEKKAREVCLADATVRMQWRRSLEHAREYVRAFTGRPASLANGRQLEFTFLMRHLDAYEKTHGNS
jgi:hypothetical protein